MTKNEKDIQTNAIRKVKYTTSNKSPHLDHKLPVAAALIAASTLVTPWVSQLANTKRNQKKIIQSWQCGCEKPSRSDNSTSTTELKEADFAGK